MKLPRKSVMLTMLACTPVLSCSILPLATQDPTGPRPDPGMRLTEVQLAPVEPPTLPTNPRGFVSDLARFHTQDLAASAVATVSAPVLDATLLVMTANGQDPTLGAIRGALDNLGTPYVVWNCADHPEGLSAAQLQNGDHGFFQGVILTDGTLGRLNGQTWESALSPAEWSLLDAYEARFGVRQVNWYTFPSASLGFQAPSALDTTKSPVTGSLTAAGKSTFFYLNGAMALPIKNAYAYLAKPLDAQTIPLLTDHSGNALISTRTSPDGREVLTMTFDGNANLTHSICLGYGLINWVTRGLFLGEQRTLLSPQVDDMFIPDDTWRANGKLGEYRMSGKDLQNVADWQQKKQNQALTSGLRLNLVFNGEGVDEAAAKDKLLTATTKLQDRFAWIDHTYDHPEPTLDFTTYAQTLAELQQNHAVAMRLDLAHYTRLNLVTPEVSGLKNPEAMRAIADAGVGYVVTDTSRPGENNPSPNEGIPNPLQSRVLMIPRYPTNLFYNVSTSGEWTGEYNYFYSAYWGRKLNYQQILDKESDVLVLYLLRGSWDPLMFHQSNLRAFSGKSTLLSDLLDATLDKYSKLSAFPIQFPTMDQLGTRMAERASYDQAHVRATIAGKTLTITAQGPARVPVSGPNLPGAETYGGQHITYVKLEAGQSVTLTLP